jgi:hypothetical protein
MQARRSVFYIEIRDRTGAVYVDYVPDHFPAAHGVKAGELGRDVPYPPGIYRADLVINGRSIASWPFIVGTRPTLAPAPPACDTHSLREASACGEESVLRVVNGNRVGSGVIVRSDATGTYVLTTRSMVTALDGYDADATAITVTSYDQQQRPTTYLVWDLATTQAATNTINDLAVLKLPPSSLRPLVLASSDELVADEHVGWLHTSTHVHDARAAVRKAAAFLQIRAGI